MSVSESLLLFRRKPTSIVGCWNLLYVIGSSSKLSNHFIISRCIGWDNHYYYWYHILRSIVIWEDHKFVVQIHEGQPSFLSLYYIVTLFFLTRICCEELGLKDLKVVVQQRVNHRHQCYYSLVKSLTSTLPIMEPQNYLFIEIIIGR